MKIRRKILSQMYCNSQLRKAIAFAVFVKTHTRNSIVKNWSINKLHDITGVSADAVKARIQVLQDMGLVEEVGVGKKHLVFKSLHSHTAHRNAVMRDIQFKPNSNLKKNAYAQEIKNIENALATMLLVEIQRRKDYAKQMIQQRRNPRTKKEYKEAVKACNNLGYGAKFTDKGISYNYMSGKIGISVGKAMQIVRYAIKNNILTMKRNITKRVSACSKYIEDMLTNYTYSYRNYIYKRYANKYAIV